MSDNTIQVKAAISAGTALGKEFIAQAGQKTRDLAFNSYDEYALFSQALINGMRGEYVSQNTPVDDVTRDITGKLYVEGSNET